MLFSDDRLCPLCTRLDLPAIFSPARFDGLPDMGTLQGVRTSWKQYIHHVGDWIPPIFRDETLKHYAPGIIPSCPFCEVVLGVGNNLGRRMASIENTRVILAMPAKFLYDFAEIDDKPATEAPASVFLLILNRTHFDELSAQYGIATGQGGLTPWVRFAHRAGAGNLVSVASNTAVESGLQDLPMQGRYLREDKVDYGLVRSWIQLCESKHDTCRRSQDWRPVPGFKLIDCHTRRIINADPNEKYAYVALSYVWGTAPLQEYTYPDLPESLPPVIMDTMQAVKKLGYRYAWIDRYCIWQEDKIHKMGQVERMDQIYGDAELVIIAVGAKDPSYGLPGLSLSRTQHYQLTKKIGEQSLVANFSHHWQLDEISRSKWSTRGWTFQETCLSRRRLYFSNYEVSFECHDMMCFEHLSRPLAFKGSLEHHERPEWNHLNTPDGVWTVINKYSERQLTYSSDRLAAVSGVLKKWSRINPGCFSYWGVPVITSEWHQMTEDSLKRAFLAGLEWDVRLKTASSGSAKLADFPSWSWVSRDGRAVFGSSQSGSYHLIPPSLKQNTENIDAEVWVETAVGNVVEWAAFCNDGGLDQSFTDWTRYLHIECWAFQVGPFRNRQLKKSSGPREDILYFPTEARQENKGRSVVLKFSPDAGHGSASSFGDRVFTAISLSPMEHSTFAIVLDTVADVTERIGLLMYKSIVDRGLSESEMRADCSLAESGFSAQRRRIRLG